MYILGEKDASFPVGVIFISVLFGSYPNPSSMIWTLIIFPSDTIAFNLAKDPVMVPTPTTSRSGGDVYSDPSLEITTLVIFPPTIIGVNDAFLPVKIDMVGGLIKLIMFVTPYPTPPLVKNIFSIPPLTIASADPL